MKIALAQIDMRLGDIEGICARIADQAAIAHRAGAQLLCTPSPLFCGMAPTALIGYPNYEHTLTTALTDLAAQVRDLDIVLIVPAVLSYEGTPLMEAFLLRDGHAVPMRTMLAQHRDAMGTDPWLPPVFDVAGVRLAVTFDISRDLDQLPRGCDLAVFFQMNGFDTANRETAAVASVADGHFRDAAARAGVWLACMAPVGAYDDTVYTGGSFVMDDGGRVVAASPCFEEDLLVQEVSRGMAVDALDDHELPSYDQEEWVWEALCLHLRDTLAAAGATRAVVPLEGDLPSSLLAALAVDALGPRNVIGAGFERSDVFTPVQEAAERERMERIRQLASNLGIRLVERAVGDMGRWMDRDVPAGDASRLRRGVDALYLADIAHEMDACQLSPLTKTESALAPAPALAAGAPTALVAPFGDIYLTALEFLARHRNRVSPSLPSSLVTLNAVEASMAEVIADAVGGCAHDAGTAQRVASLLSRLEPAQIDGTIEAHVDRNRGFEDLPVRDRAPEATALILLLVRRGERARRSLPPAPVVSARSFEERAWPMDLGWSDLGRHGADALHASDLAAAEMERLEGASSEQGQRVRGEILDFLGALLGLTPEQREELASEDGQRKMRENFERIEAQLQGMLDEGGEPPDISMPGQRGEHGGAPSGMSMHTYPFFSQN